VTSAHSRPGEADSGELLPGTLVLLRHGESTANAAGLFTGLLDVPLTAAGEREARHAGELLARQHLDIRAVMTSTMQRARRSAALVVAALGPPVPVVTAEWRLNERNYGALTGRTKAEVLAEVGPAQFIAWRRSMYDAPPPMTPELLHRITAAAGPAARPRPEFGLTESLADVVTRVRPLLTELLVPTLRDRSVLVVAHGNSLRALVSIIDGLDEPAVAALNLPTGQPLRYRLTAEGRSAPFGGAWLDPDTAANAAARIASEGGT
jgi:2,3-bisphosphoglycerate-dependent phosphoglycerate mutase